MKISFTKKSIPLALFIFLSLTFGLWIYWQGFYSTDWLIVLASHLDDPGEILNNLPRSGLLYRWLLVRLMAVTGPVPILWQTISLIFRYLTVLAMWWSLTKLWPGRLRPVTWMAFVFAIYPIFDQQSVSVTNTPLWIAYALYFLSLGAMIQSLRQARYSWIYAAVGLIGTSLHLIILNDFTGMEILRPLIIWFVSEDIAKTRNRFGYVLIKWLPYGLAILITLVLQYLFEQNSTAAFLAGMDGLSGWIGWLQSLLKELIGLVFSAWNQTINPSLIQINNLTVWLSFAVASIIAGLVGFYWLHLNFSDQTQNKTSLQKVFFRQAIVLGLLALLMGVFAALEYQATSGAIPRSGNLLAAMFGLSILLVVFVEWAINDQSRKILFLCMLIGLAIAFHLRTANDYRWLRTKQNNLYWQLFWRAPHLEPFTTILSDSEFFAQNGGETTATAILNLLYPSTADQKDILYEFRLVNSDPDAAQQSDEQPAAADLVITYAPELGNCLWLLSPEDSERPQVSKVARQSLGNIDLSRIGNLARGDWQPPITIFGSEPDHSWCYYYQKAELARQADDFQTIVKLADEAQQAGHKPNNVQEWLPFIVGYAYENRWEDAQKLSRTVFEDQPSFSQWLCTSWKQILAESNPAQAERGALEKMLADFQCNGYQN